ncbi:cupin domain-containing protein [Paenibacillus sp. JSM ZJ436]|uniref:cupin domain-containing protein n=1 Tax=Paenibacillus sp. JSM ZJ436 TaxID=3376190 RepID=UPI00379A5FE7
MGKSNPQSDFQSEAESQKTLIHLPGSGRNYVMGPMRSVFLADGSETNDRYCVSEWWLDAQSDGPGPHCHEEHEELFYVIEGVMSFLVGDESLDAPKGTFIRIPPNVMHDFMNKSKARAGVLNFYMPGGFEEKMPSLVQWYEQHNQQNRDSQ